MKNTFLGMVLAATLLLAPAHADSLLDPNGSNLYSPAPIAVGQLITVKIVDKTRTLQGVSLTRKVDDKVDGPSGTGLLQALTGFNLSGGEDRKTQSEASSKSEFESTVTAKVVAVEPGAVLVLEAASKMNLDGKERIVAVRGKVRRQDVPASNTILSSQMADAEVYVEGAQSSPVGGGALSWLLGMLR